MAALRKAGIGDLHAVHLFVALLRARRSDPIAILLPRSTGFSTATAHALNCSVCSVCADRLGVDV
jgi:hypothetical protein